MEKDKNEILRFENLSVKLKNGNVIKYDDFSMYDGDFLLLRGFNGSGKSTTINLFNFGNTVSYIQSYTKREMDNPQYGIIYNGKWNIISDKLRKDEINKNIVKVEQEDDYYHQSIYDILRSLTVIGVDKISNNKINDEILFYYYKYFSKFTKKNNSHNEFEKGDKVLPEDDLKKLNNIYTYSTMKMKYDEPGYFSDDFKLKSQKLANIYKRKMKYDTKFRFSFITQYSGGQRKMVQIIQNIMKYETFGCKLLIFDEPLNNLDRDNKGFVKKIVESIIENNDCAIIMITHCLIFDHINKVLDLVKESEEDGSILIHATLKEEQINPIRECIKLW